MKRSFLLCIIAATCAASLYASQNEEIRVAPFVQWRSQGRDTARKLVGTTSHHVYLYDMESFYGTFNITPQYDQTFHGDHLLPSYFGSSLVNCNSIVIAGTAAPALDVNTNWMAENFYLPRDFKSTISFAPKVQNFLVDFNLYVGLDEWVKGLYFRFYGPVVNNRVTLNPCEAIQNPGTVGYAPGFFSPIAVPANTLLQSALSFFNGNTTITVPNIITTPLLRAKIACDKQSTTGFAELRMELGWNYLHEDYHFGINIQAAAPTGKRPDGEFIFETQVGNGKHWELGAGLSGHWTMWRSQDEEKHLDFVFEADVTHLFNASQTRTLDLIGKPDSRYLLATKMNLKPTQNLFGSTTAGGGTGTAATSQFNAEYSPVANFSTREVNVSIGVQGDIVGMLNYTHRGFSWDLGYNYWGMSHEHIELRDANCAPVFPENTWAIKGDAQVYGFNADTGAAIALSGTESLATIHQGTNIPQAGATGGNPATNLGVDMPQFAQTGATNAEPIINVSTAAGSPQIQTSIQPVFITVEDLNLTGAESRGSSNKLFTHFSYTWIDREDWIPYLGAGGYAEFGNTGHDNDNNNNCNHGISSALSEWGIWVKGGVSFD